MSAPAHEEPCDPGLDEVLWQAWKAMDLPEGYRAEIIEGSIEVSPTGRRRHTVLVHRLRRALESRLTDSGLDVYQDGNVIRGRKVCIPDLFVAPEDLDEIPDEEGLGVDATRIALVAEIVSPARRPTAGTTSASTAGTPRPGSPFTSSSTTSTTRAR